MPLPTSGAISFGNIRTEMNAGTGSSYGAMPLNDATFRSRLTNTAQNATLSLSALRGNAYQRFTIAADTTNYNIRNALVAAGWNGTAKGSADVVVNGGIVVGTPSTGSYAMDTGGPWPGPSTIFLYNNGFVVGMGGAGGDGGDDPPTGTPNNGFPGLGGGPGLLVQRALTLINTGTIGGGGGGGGGATRSRNLPTRWGGGGGGGGRTGRTNSAGGIGGIGNPRANDGTPGAVGTFSGGGVGGVAPGPRNPGGTGGAWGAAGANGLGSPVFGGGNPGGAGGVAVQGWSAVTQSPAGTISGPVAG